MPPCLFLFYKCYLMKYEEYLADVITGRPHDLEIGGERLRLYPVTLAKTFVLRRQIEALGIDSVILKLNPMVECLRLSEAKPEAVASVLAVYAADNSREGLFDHAGMVHRRELFLRLRKEHLAGLLVTVLTADHTEELMEELGINSERERLSEVLKVKEEVNRNSLTFGGKSLFGSFVAPLMEMGFRSDEILYEQGYDYLRLMLADKVTSVYLSDDELERLPQSAGGALIDGDDGSSVAEVAGMIGNK